MHACVLCTAKSETKLSFPIILRIGKHRLTMKSYGTGSLLLQGTKSYYRCYLPRFRGIEIKIFIELALIVDFESLRTLKKEQSE